MTKTDRLEGIPISEVSRILGVPVPTIRSWERRYGLPGPPRTAGAHRRYTRAEAALLRTVRDEIAAGRPARLAAARALKFSSGDNARRPYVEAFLEAAMESDPASMRRTLERARTRLGLERAIEAVVFPALREVGDRWASGRCDVGHEHLASGEVRKWFSTQPLPRPTGRTVVLACGPADIHSIGLEAFGLALAKRGWRALVLGPMTPARALRRAAEDSGAAAVVLTSHQSVFRRAALSSLRGVQPLRRTKLFYAGNAFSTPASRKSAPGTYLGEDFIAAIGEFESSVRA